MKKLKYKIYTTKAISQAINKLCMQEPLCDITGIDEEWSDMKKPKYKINDKIEIINYGQLYWIAKKEQENYFKLGYTEFKIPKHLISSDDHTYCIDILPEKIGKIGIINKVTVVQGIPQYSIKDIGAWFSENQMKLIK